ncbi:type IV secretion system protein [Stenotrophomonas ginsengisoli]|uniref:type IV secretion system protein n=1 Tax=Stenotrophomonas ginsengisoli TaxID=336566 RepID=UPI00070A2284|nr:type IV secretion system protein [Stenotrophomonas ginsengisoli]
MEWNGIIDGLQQMAFFEAVYSFLETSIDKFADETLNRVTRMVAGAALTALTIWFMIQGFRIVTGQSRESMSALMVNSARAAVICVCASGFAFYGTDLRDFFVDDLGGQVTELVTGDDGNVNSMIDKNLALMTISMMAIDQVQAQEDKELDDSKRQAKMMAGVGAGGPAIVAGSMLLLYQIAIAMFIGFGPIFILCLLFDQTKSLFQRWLFYGIGTLFSQAVLVFVTSVAMEMVARVAVAAWASKGLSSIEGLEFLDQQGLTAQAVQQGGMGLILSTLILATPPMAAMFFQGSLGNFSTYNGMGGQFAAGVAEKPGGAGAGQGHPRSMGANVG